jgi:hypothetical protein
MLQQIVGGGFKQFEARFSPRSFVPHRLFSFVSLVYWGAFAPPLCGVVP